MAWLLPPLPPNFSAAIRDVCARRPESRMAAAERLSAADEAERDEALAGLRALATDPHPSVRATAFLGLGQLGQCTDVPVLLAALEDPAAEVREIAALSATRLGGAAIVPALTHALASAHPEVRFQAVAGIAELIPEQAPSLLVPMLDDPDPEVRGHVVGALAGLEHPRLAGHIARALGDTSAEVQLEAALALADRGDGRGKDVLLTTLRERHRSVEVAFALAEIGCQEARDPLYRQGTSLFGNAHARAAAGAALHRLGDPRGLDILRRALRSFSALARTYAVELVRETDAEPLLGELVRLARRPRSVDPLTLADALAHFAPRSALARKALEALAGRGGEAAEVARVALLPPETTQH
jgi:HEAT repeat protein